MKNYLLLNYTLNFFKKNIFIFFTVIIFLLITFTKSVSEENAFTVNNVIVTGQIDLNF